MENFRNRLKAIIIAAIATISMVWVFVLLNGCSRDIKVSNSDAPMGKTNDAGTEDGGADVTEKPAGGLPTPGDDSSGRNGQTAGEKAKKPEKPAEPSVEEDIPSIAETYKDYFPIGSAIEPNQTTGLIAGLLKKHVNMLVAENAMKPVSIQPTEGNFQWSQADKIVRFAKENGMEIRFHTLVWHNQVPAWFFKDKEGKPMVDETDPKKREANKKLLLQRLETHVRTIVERYKDDIKSWDVVNEVIEPNHPGGMRNSPWYQITGTEFIETAFRAAREAGGPDIKLYINDYGTDDPVKRDRLYELVKELLDKGVPIDGVGHQTHINIYSPSIDRIIDSMKKFAGLGLDNIITELDMSVYSWDNRSDYGDEIPEYVLITQAQRYRDLFAALKENKDIISAVVFWGISDRYTWLNSFPVKRTDAPLLFDRNFHAKPAYWGVVDPSKVLLDRTIEETAEPDGKPASATGKLWPSGNPLVSHKFGADPFALVYRDRVYLYMTNDVLEYDADGNVKENTYGKINKISVISSDDLVNWTDHGEISVAGPQGAAKWASQSWAPAAAHKVIDGKDKFFLYFANNASGIGVLTSDSPTGPWDDPIKKPLISRATPGVQGVVWLFDPAVFVDDDGKAYIYFGGGVPKGQDEMPNTARVMRLGDDMISVEGEAVTIPAPFMFEASGINKYNGVYYYTYCSNFYGGTRPKGSPPAGEIAYMTGSSPLGPWEYKGTILKNPGYFFGVGGNNHHSIFRLKDAWYIAYHAQTLSKAMGIPKGYRSTHLNRVFFNKDGTIKEIAADYKGVEQLKTLNPYKRVEAETFAWNAGILTKSAGNDNSQQRVLTDIDNGDWIALSKVDFSEDGASLFTASVSNIKADSMIELRLDGVDGVLIGTLPVSSNGGGQADWTEIRTEVSDAVGVHDLFIIFKGPPNKKLFDFDYWQFTKM